MPDEEVLAQIKREREEARAATDRALAEVLRRMLAATGHVSHGDPDFLVVDDIVVVLNDDELKAVEEVLGFAR